MKKSSLQHTFSIFLAVGSFILCLLIVKLVNDSLESYKNDAESIVSVEAVNELLKQKYPEAYFPYKDLDNHINNYSDIDHIYRLDFTQKMPLYVYTITSRTLGSSITYLVVFDALGYIKDIEFLNGSDSFFHQAFTDEKGVINSMVGTKAPYLETEKDVNNVISSNYIKKGIKSASYNFVYEVLN